MKKMYYFKVGDIVETLNGSSKALIIRIEHSTMWIQWLGNMPTHSQDISLYGTEYADKFLRLVSEV